MGLSSCKTEFEKVRQSNDPPRVLESANKYYDADEFDKAQLLYELAITSYRGKAEAENMFFRYAYTHFHQQQYILANHYFQNFSNTFTNSDKREEAAFMAAYASYKQSPSYRLDQEFTNKAIEGLQTFVNTYPRSERIAECNKIIDELRSKQEKKMYEEGMLYFDLRNYQSANQSFGNLLREFPETQNAKNVRYMMIRSAFDLAKNSTYEKRKERFVETIDLAQRFLKKYDKSSERREIKGIIADANSEIKKLIYD